MGETVITIGYEDAEKAAIIDRYCAEHSIRKVFVLSPEAFPLAYSGRPFAVEHVGYNDIIRYVYFYRLLQEIDRDTLIVINECLRTQNRYDLTYNCIRNYLNQTNHQLVFQQLPQIDTADDFMILFDFATKSRWKRRSWDIGLILDNVQVQVRPLLIAFNRIDVPTSGATKTKYAKERESRFATLGAGDPHTLPRNLYLIGGKDKLAWMDAQASGGQLGLFGETRPRQYVARNQRLKRDNILTYDQVQRSECPYTVVELPHRFIDYSDFIKTTWQAESDVLVADLKVDQWYWNRYTEWQERIHETSASLQQS